MDQNAQTLPIQKLKQELTSTHDALIAIQHDRNEKLQILSRLISHLCTATKGFNPDLDNKLNKLRHQLHLFENIEKALPEINDVEKLLAFQSNYLQQILQQNRDELIEIAKYLDRVSPIGEQEKSSLNFYIKSLNNPISNVWLFLPKINELITIYQQMIQQHIVDNTQFTVEPKYIQLSGELLNKLNQFEFRETQQDKVQLLKQQLSNEISVEILLDSYQNVLNLLLENLAQEKSASQEFLYSINDALAAVKNVVSDSFNKSLQSHKNKGIINQDINQKMSNVGEALNDTQDLQQLKSTLMGELSGIKSALNKKEQLEKDDYHCLQESMQMMRKELSEMTNEANRYKEQLAEQQKINLIDNLTQLPNRAALEDRMKYEYRQFKRNKQPLWVCVADIDHFKRVNDTYGHSTGDKTLKVVAMAIKNSLRESEFAARFGGEEFVLLIPNLDHSQVAPLLNRIREKIQKIPFKVKQEQITVTISIGAAQIFMNEHISEVFERADAALYQAKDSGRNRVILDY